MRGGLCAGRLGATVRARGEGLQTPSLLLLLLLLRMRMLIVGGAAPSVRACLSARELDNLVFSNRSERHRLGTPLFPPRSPWRKWKKMKRWKSRGGKARPNSRFANRFWDGQGKRWEGGNKNGKDMHQPQISTSLLPPFLLSRSKFQLKLWRVPPFSFAVGGDGRRGGGRCRSAIWQARRMAEEEGIKGTQGS